LLRWTIRATTTLLLWSALLAVVGIFDEALRWDLFPPRVEATLVGVLLSSLVLGAVGVALVFVLGVLEVVRALQIVVPLAPEAASSRRPRIATAAALLGVVALIGLLHSIDRRVETRRLAVFRSYSQNLIERIPSETLSAITDFVEGDCTGSDGEIRSLLSVPRDVDWIRGISILVPGESKGVGVRLSSSWNREIECRRIYGAEARERAVLAALHGDDSEIARLNVGRQFVSLHRVRALNSEVLVRIQGDRSAKFDSDVDG